MPDSLGKQHIVSITEIYRDKTVSNQKNITAERESVKEDKSVKSKVESVKVTEKSETKTKTQYWIYIVAVILSLGILIFVFLMLKKYRII